MIKKLLSILILTSFVFGVSNENLSTSFDHNNETVSIKSDFGNHGTTIVASDCEECEDDGCHGTHCAHHCSGSYTMLEAKQVFSLISKVSLNNKIVWYFKYHYDEPFLDPALKPPLFS